MNYSVLIIDDEKELSEYTAKYFNMSGVTAQYALDSKTALEYLKENTYSLILLDINLGDRSGFELCKQVRENYDMPILFISARTSDDDVLIALNIGGDDYIKKPYTLNILLAKVKAVLDRYEKLTASQEAEGLKPNRLGYSARVNFDVNGFFFKGEYVSSGNKVYDNPNYGAEGFEDDGPYLVKKGNAQLVETGYTGKGLGVSLSLRRLEWMDSKIVAGGGAADINMMNYVPALCTQYTYMLANLHPYGPRTGEINSRFVNSGEMGGQFDIFYNFRRGTALGGKRGMRVHANFSTYYAIAEEGGFAPGNLLFRDLSIDFEKQWTKQFKSVVMWSMQEYNPSYGANKSTYLQNIIVADLLYKYTDTFSTRLELQYLFTQEDKKDWMAALLEVNFAPSWSIYVSDMWNHGLTKLHYYNGGVSYTKSRTRLALGYGRFKDGYICSGGVCRTVPAYTGFNLTLTTSF